MLTDFRLLSNTPVADTTVTVIQDHRTMTYWVPGSVWTFVAQATGEDLLVDPTGRVHVDLDTRFADETVGPVLEFLAEVL